MIARFLTLAVCVLAAVTSFSQRIERIFMIYADGYHPAATAFFEVDAIGELERESLVADTAIMLLPAHPTIGRYGDFHTTSFPNVSTLMGSLFLDTSHLYLPEYFPEKLSVQVAGSSSYRSFSSAFDVSITSRSLSDKAVTDTIIAILKEHEGLFFARLHYQTVGNAGRVDVADNDNVQTIWEKDGPYHLAIEAFDREIGRLFKYLKDSYLWDTSLIIFLGDGQASTGWHPYLHSESALSPFVMKIPGQGFKRIPYAETLDVVPTVLGRFPGKEHPDYLHGVDLLEVYNEGKEHSGVTKKVNQQIYNYAGLKAKCDLLSLKFPQVNVELMKLQHDYLSAHQFYHAERIMEWKEAESVENLLKSNAFVLEKLQNIISEYE